MGLRESSFFVPERQFDSWVMARTLLCRCRTQTTPLFLPLINLTSSPLTFFTSYTICAQPKPQSGPAATKPPPPKNADTYSKAAITRTVRDLEGIWCMWRTGRMRYIVKGVGISHIIIIIGIGGGGGSSGEGRREAG
jgi:hypothetical protein